MQEDPSPGNQVRWKEKKHTADVEADTRRRVFKDAPTKLNRPTPLCRVTKIMREMEGAPWGDGHLPWPGGKRGPRQDLCRGPCKSRGVRPH